MSDTLIKLIPLIQGYPMWLQAIVASWIVITAVVVAMLIITPKTRNEDRSVVPNSRAESVESKRSVNQQTGGDNSPAISNVEGNVTITVEQKTNAK